MAGLLSATLTIHHLVCLAQQQWPSLVRLQPGQRLHIDLLGEPSTVLCRGCHTLRTRIAASHVYAARSARAYHTPLHIVVCACFTSCTHSCCRHLNAGLE